MDFEQELEALRKRHVLHIEDEERELASVETTDTGKQEVSPIETNVLLYQQTTETCLYPSVSMKKLFG